jgi:hypothetical protein
VSQPYPVFGSQNLKDDDARVIDDYLIETDAPPDMTKAEQPIDATPATPIAVTTVLKPCSELVLLPTFDPVLLMPADRNRKHAYIRVVSPTSVATDGIRFGDTPQNARNGARLVHGNAPTIDDYTGAIWAYPQAVTGAANSAVVNVEYWAVTV